MRSIGAIEKRWPIQSSCPVFRMLTTAGKKKLVSKKFEFLFNFIIMDVTFIVFEVRRSSWYLEVSVLRDVFWGVQGLAKCLTGKSLIWMEKV